MSNNKWKLVKKYLEPVIEYLEAGDVTEIMVNGPDKIFVKRLGVTSPIMVDASFGDENTVVTTIKQIAVASGQVCDNQNYPELNAKLWDGSRFCGVLYPWSEPNSTMTIRVFPKEKLTADKLIGFGSVTAEMMEYLRKAVKLHRNILMSGSTDSGKTTFLNILASYIEDTDRLITIEDTQEIQVDIPNWVRHVSIEKKHKDDGRIVKTLADLIRISLRENPDRICVGEIRDSDSAISFMRALNTGHNGCLSSVHANSPGDAINRLSDLLREGGTPFEFAKVQICSNLQIIVQAEEIKGVGKRIVEIAEISRNGEAKPIYSYDYLDGKHKLNDENYASSTVLRDAEKYGIN